MAADRAISAGHPHKSIDQLIKENRLLLIELASLQVQSDRVLKLHEEWLKYQSPIDGSAANSGVMKSKPRPGADAREAVNDSHIAPSPPRTYLATRNK